MIIVVVCWLSWMIISVFGRNSLMKAHEHEFINLAVSKLKTEMEAYDLNIDYASAIDDNFYIGEWYERAPFEVRDAEGVLGKAKERKDLTYDRDRDTATPEWRYLDKERDGGWTKHHIVGIKPMIAFWNRAISYGHRRYLKWAAYGLWHTLEINDDKKIYNIKNEQVVKYFLYQFWRDCETDSFVLSEGIWNDYEQLLRERLTELLAWLPGNIFMGWPNSERGDDPGNAFEEHAGSLINSRSARHYDITWNEFCKMEYYLFLYKTEKNPDLCNVIAAGVGIMALNHYYPYDKNDWVHKADGYRLIDSGDKKVKKWVHPKFTHQEEMDKFLDEEREKEKEKEENEVLVRQERAKKHKSIAHAQKEAGIDDTCKNPGCILKCNPGDTGKIKTCDCDGFCALETSWQKGKKPGGLCNVYIYKVRTVKYEGSGKVQPKWIKGELIVGSDKLCPQKQEKTVAWKCTFQVKCP